ncbi:hypothetical protein [Pseudomonas sp. NPDC089534]|uniref:hypothetical protein n=1 Tax=Pseudomonas sp. NPDC089534 TaxID=3364468 RepID=UPI003822BA51
MKAFAFLNLTTGAALDVSRTLYLDGIAVMIYALRVKLMILAAIAFVLPFSIFEVYVVFTSGSAEPYSYFLSIPLAIVSFLLLQLATGYSVVKGWAVCGMPRNYIYLGVWLLSVFLLFVLPAIYSGGES